VANAKCLLLLEQGFVLVGKMGQSIINVSNHARKVGARVFMLDKQSTLAWATAGTTIKGNEAKWTRHTELFTCKMSLCISSMYFRLSAAVLEVLATGWDSVV